MSCRTALTDWLAQAPKEEAQLPRRRIRIYDDDCDEPVKKQGAAESTVVETVNIISDDDDPNFAVLSRHVSEGDATPKASQAVKEKVKPAEKSKRQLRSNRFEGEAEEVADADSSSEADESDQNAQELYRSAMLGVRNRPNALQQVRTSTTPCAVCARFAKFLEYFL
jgi:hypothetical protein